MAGLVCIAVVSGCEMGVLGGDGNFSVGSEADRLSFTSSLSISLPMLTAV